MQFSVTTNGTSLAPAGEIRGANYTHAAGRRIDSPENMRQSAPAARLTLEPMITIDGNTACATLAHRLSEVIAIYPITPSSPMGDLTDSWSANGRPNLWGAVPQVIEMQSEAGAAGAVHGALQRGALATTFTSSQGLLLMIPNMYKIAGELLPAVFHVAARTVATHALSIFGDHSDVMACRSTGFAMLCAGSVQEAHDFALLSHAVALESRVPMLHFFDGFRTSHEVAKITPLEDSQVRALIRDEWLQALRQRNLSPDRPVTRGTAQNPDVYFQSREAVNPFYARLPALVQATMVRFAELTGRAYRAFDYAGANDAERVLVLMGSGAEAAHDVVDDLNAAGARLGLIKVRLFRPFNGEDLVAALPATVRRIAVLDRTKEPGAVGEPLYQDVITALAEHMASGQARFTRMPLVVGGRYGLSSKEFTPGMIKAVFDNLAADRPRNHFTVGIHDDVSHTSLDWDPGFATTADRTLHAAIFHGLGSDGTVSANRNSIQIIGEQTDYHAQGHFVFDSKKAGAVTVSHLRFGNRPIRSTYLIGENQAEFVACHQTSFLENFELLDTARPGATFLLNAAWSAEETWDKLPRHVQAYVLDKQLKVFVIDAYRVARQHGLGRRINTVMQTCYFALSGLLPRAEAIERIKASVSASYRFKGGTVLDANFAAIDQTLENLHPVPVPGTITASHGKRQPVPADAPAFIREVTSHLMAGRGDSIPVSLMPADGTWPLGTAALEKRRLALEVPVLEADICIQCGKCAFVCPHSAIRSKVFDPALLKDAPPDFRSAPVVGPEFARGTAVTYQVSPDDCTGCTLCVEVCPARDKSNRSRKALNLHPLTPILERERAKWRFFETLPEYDRRKIRWDTIKGAAVGKPLFEFSSACVGCGETTYIRLATQLFGDRMIIANATGCSSIYGGNLPTSPYTTDANGRGPAWCNSLFEDNAEFGLGIRIALDEQIAHARELLAALAGDVGTDLARAVLDANQTTEAGIQQQRERVAQLKTRLEGLDQPAARNLLSLLDTLVRKSVWIVGGDGWAYDIGFSGLDHVLTSGRNVNILVLDTEVYSNTGGQMSKATPRAAVAKFAAGGKSVPKKDLAMIAMAYENVYVAQVASGAKDVHTLRAFQEAESWDGPSLIIAYSPCIAHGVDLHRNLTQQELAVKSGHWALFRYDPRLRANGENPLLLDSRHPQIPYREFAQTEMRFGILMRTQPDVARALLDQAQREVEERYRHYEQLAGLDYSGSSAATAGTGAAAPGADGRDKPGGQ
jgi:pyruvate-ferredoxin/flavodoxin oxidoreductase